MEAWARAARYAALRKMALEQETSLVLLAHHQQDQAETFLLQALRGGGTSGLAGMPRVAERGGVTWARPWLAQSRDAIDAYLRRHRLRCIDDESNADVHLARNRLRHQVVPALIQAFPQAPLAMATAAGWAHEASVCLRDLAQLDLATITGDASLRIEPWSALSWERRSNALRHWLHERTAGAVSAALVRRLMVEIPVCRDGRWLIPGGELQAYRGRLTFSSTVSSTSHRPAQLETTLSVAEAGAYPLPGWGGFVRATRTREAGVSLDLLRRIALLPRSGAEQFQAGPGRPPRALKKQYQAVGVSAARRSGPLLYSEGRLLFVPGLGIDARVIAPPGNPQMALEWCEGPSIVDAAAAAGSLPFDR